MKAEDVQFTGGLPVDGYGPGFFRVGGARIDGPALLSADGAAAWAPGDLAALTAWADRAEIVLLGTGADWAQPDAQMKEALEAVGFGVEAMATPAACRTYNVLLSEARPVIAALIPV